MSNRRAHSFGLLGDWETLALLPVELVTMPQSQSMLAPLLAKLMRWSALDAADQRAVLELPGSPRRIARGNYIVREGDKTNRACLLLTGFAYRHKMVGDGGRQILAIHMAGDIVDLQNAFLRAADHNVQAITWGELVEIPRQAVQELAFERPRVGYAMWCDTLVDASIQREWTANLGRRSARVRTAHLLCEIGMRIELAGLGRRQRYELPMTQEELADALGLTSVHVNRTLMALNKDGLLHRSRDSIFVHDWRGLAREGDFSPDYLHVQREQTATPAPNQPELRASAG